MKKFRTILSLVVAAVAAVIYFAGELGTLLQRVEEEKEIVAESIGKLQDKVGDSVKEINFRHKGDLVQENPVLLKQVPSQILEYTGHILSYNNETRLPNWVAYQLTKEEALGDNPRKDKFARDKRATGPQASKEDYRNSGWDRGHMAPAGDMKWSETAMDETYYFTNICPQNHELNNGDWKELEEKCRDWAVGYGAIEIVCGPIITKNVHGRLGENDVVIPDKFFKVLLVKKGGEYKGVGFIFDNPPQRKSKISTQPSPNRPLESYVVSIDEVEAATGIDFYTALPDAVENAVEKQTALF